MTFNLSFYVWGAGAASAGISAGRARGGRPSWKGWSKPQIFPSHRLFRCCAKRHHRHLAVLCFIFALETSFCSRFMLGGKAVQDPAGSRSPS